MSPTPRAGRVVIVTGASSGIGRAAAVQFGAQGARLVLAARDGGRLADAADECRAAGATAVRVVATDVNDETAVGALVEAALSEFDRVDVVVHAATVMAYGRVEDVPSAIFEGVVDTAIHGTAHLARATLPVFRRQRAGTLIVVNSLVGQIAAPFMGAYATAKWGQLGLVRVLQLEVRRERNVHVCLVSPGGVDTPIYYQAANYAGRTGRPPPPIDPPEKVARAILALADRPRRKVEVGAFNRLIVLGFRTMPWVYGRLVTPLMKVAALSRQPVPPTEGNVLTPVGEQEAVHGRWPGRF